MLYMIKIKIIKMENGRDSIRANWPKRKKDVRHEEEEEEERRRIFLMRKKKRKNSFV